MRFFTILDFQHWIEATVFGLFLCILAYVTWAGYESRKIGKADLSDASMPESPPGSEHNAIAPVLVITYVGVILWILGYMLRNGIFGGPIT